MGAVCDGSARRSGAHGAAKRSNASTTAKAHIILLCRALFSAGRYQEVLDVMEAALEASGEDYNVYVPIANSLGALGKKEA